MFETNGLLGYLTLMIIISSKLGYGTITDIKVPPYIPIGEESTMECSFNDEFSTVIEFYWSQSEHNQPERSDAITQLAYVKSTGTMPERWIDNTNGEMSAVMDIPNKKSTLTIHSADLAKNEKRYWCIIELRFDTWSEFDDAVVSVPTTPVIHVDGKECNATYSVKEGVKEGVNVTCSAYDYRPNADLPLNFTGSGTAHNVTTKGNIIGGYTFFNSSVNITTVSESDGPQVYTCDMHTAAFTSKSSCNITVTVPTTPRATTLEETTPVRTSQEQTTKESSLSPTGPPESTSASCNCDGDSKLCDTRTCTCGQGHECVSGKCLACKTVAAVWTTNGTLSNDTKQYESSTQCSNMDSTLDESGQNKGCCVTDFSSGSIITSFQISFDINSDLTLTDVYDLIQTAIDNGEVDVNPRLLRVTALNECDEGLSECANPETCRDTVAGYCCVDNVDDDCSGEYEGEPGGSCTCIKAKESPNNTNLVIGLSVTFGVVAIVAGVVAFMIFRSKKRARVNNDSTPSAEDETKYNKKKEETDKVEDDT